MKRIFNSIFGHTILQLAIFAIKNSNSLKEKYNSVEIQILDSLSFDTQIPNSLILSIIRIEDKRFYHHLGVDFYSILRATKNSAFKKRLEGASTIHQQLIRTITGDKEINIKRKIIEILLSSLANNRFTKEEILSSYSKIYQFENTVGIKNFCEQEFYNLNNLTSYEIAQIAARIKYPSINEMNYLRYLKRVRLIEIQYYTQQRLSANNGKMLENLYFSNQVTKQLI